MITFSSPIKVNVLYKKKLNEGLTKLKELKDWGLFEQKKEKKIED